MAELDPGSIVILDSSVLFAMGGPSNEKYRAFENHVTRRDVSARIPDLVAEELGESPETYSYQRDRLRVAQKAGWLERAAVEYDPAVSDAIDRTRKRMAALSAADVTEDEIEKTDTVLSGLAYQYAARDPGHVTVLVSDRVAENAIADVLDAMGVGDETTVLEGRSFLFDLVDQV